MKDLVTKIYHQTETLDRTAFKIHPLGIISKNQKLTGFNENQATISGTLQIAVDKSLQYQNLREYAEFVREELQNQEYTGTRVRLLLGLYATIAGYDRSHQKSFLSKVRKKMLMKSLVSAIDQEWKKPVNNRTLEAFCDQPDLSPGSIYQPVALKQLQVTDCLLQNQDIAQRCLYEILQNQRTPSIQVQSKVMVKKY